MEFDLKRFPSSHRLSLFSEDMQSVMRCPSTSRRYDQSLVSVSLAEGLNGPSTAADITAAAATILNTTGTYYTRFWNSAWAGFSVSGSNGTDVSTSANWLTRNAFVFTLSRQEGYEWDLSSLDFLGARGGASGMRGFEIFASIDGESMISASISSCRSRIWGSFSGTARILIPSL